MTTHLTTDNTVSKPVPANKKLLSVSASFCYSECIGASIYSVNADVPLWHVVSELNAAISVCSDMLEQIEQETIESMNFQRTIKLFELHLMLTKLDQAAGLCASIGNTIKSVEEEEDLSNE